MIRFRFYVWSSASFWVRFFSDYPAATGAFCENTVLVASNHVGTFADKPWAWMPARVLDSVRCTHANVPACLRISLRA